MSSRWFPNLQSIDCDLVLEATREVLRTVAMPVVPHVGAELELDVSGQPTEGPLYRVVRVRYHLRPRRITTRDDLFGVSVFVEPVAQS